jgi:hypothetical protein
MARKKFSARLWISVWARIMTDLVLALRDEMQPSAFAWHDEDAWTA